LRLKHILIYSLLPALFLLGCGSKKLVFSKEGLSDSKKEEVVVGFKDLRKMYDSKNYKDLFQILTGITEMPDMNDYFIHFLLIESAYVLDKLSTIEDYYTKSKYAFFYKGLIAYERADYETAIKFFKVSKEKNPVVSYFIGASYYFKNDKPMASGFLKISLDWDYPWTYLTYASIFENTGDNDTALKYLNKAQDKTYDFENNLIIDILSKKSQIFLNKNDYDASLFHAKQIYEKDKVKALTISDPGDIYLASGKVKEALEFWKKNLSDIQLPEHIKTLIQNKVEVIEKISEDDKDDDQDN